MSYEERQKTFNKNAWFWQLADGRIWSTAKAAFVPEDEADEWLAGGDLEIIPPSPVDERGSRSVDGLKQALGFYGLPKGELATAAELDGVYSEDVQARLNDFARTRGYDDILSAVSYVSSANPVFAAEANYCAGARDKTWAAAYAILAAVEAGERPLPAREEFLAELPELTWPEPEPNKAS